MTWRAVVAEVFHFCGFITPAYLPAVPNAGKRPTKVLFLGSVYK